MCSIRLLENPVPVGTTVQNPSDVNFKGKKPVDLKTALKELEEHERVLTKTNKFGKGIAKVGAGLAFATLFGILPTSCQKDDDILQPLQPQVVINDYSNVTVNVDFDFSVDITNNINITQESNADAILAQMLALLQTYLPHLENLDSIAGDVTLIRTQSADFQRQVLSLLSSLNLTSQQMLDVLNRIGYDAHQISVLIANGYEPFIAKLDSIFNAIMTNNQLTSQNNTILSNFMNAVIHSGDQTREVITSGINLLASLITGHQGSNITINDIQTLLEPFYQKLAEISVNTYNNNQTDQAILQKLTEYSNTMTNFLPILLQHIDEIPANYTALMNQAMTMFQNYALDVEGYHIEDMSQWESLKAMIQYLGNALLQQGAERNQMLDYGNNLMIQWQQAQEIQNEELRADLDSLFSIIFNKQDSLIATGQSGNITLGNFYNAFINFAIQEHVDNDSIIALMNNCKDLLNNGVSVLTTGAEKIEMIRLGIGTIINNNLTSDSLIRAKLQQILDKIPAGCNCNCNIDGDSLINILINIYNEIHNGSGSHEGFIDDIEELDGSIVPGGSGAKGPKSGQKSRRYGTAQVLPNGMIIGANHRGASKIAR